MSNFAGIKKQGAGCIWDWPYPLTNVSNVIREAMRVIFQGKLMRSGEILQHIMQAMFCTVHCTDQFKEAEIFLNSSFDYSTKPYSKEEAMLINSQSLS